MKQVVHPNDHKFTPKRTIFVPIDHSEQTPKVIEWLQRNITADTDLVILFNSFPSAKDQLSLMDTSSDFQQTIDKIDNELAREREAIVINYAKKLNSYKIHVSGIVACGNLKSTLDAQIAEPASMKSSTPKIIFASLTVTSISGLALLYSAAKNTDLEQIVLKFPKGRELLDLVLEIELKQVELQNSIADLGNNAFNQLQSTKKSVTDTIESTKSNITSTFDDISNVVVSTKNSVTQTIADAADAVFTGVTNLKDGISKTVKSVEDTADKTVECAKDKYNSVLGLVTGSNVKKVIDPVQKVDSTILTVQNVQQVQNINTIVQQGQKDSSVSADAKKDEVVSKEIAPVSGEIHSNTAEPISNEIPAKFDIIPDAAVAIIESTVNEAPAPVNQIVTNIELEVRAKVDEAAAKVEPTINEVSPPYNQTATNIELVCKEVPAKVDAVAAKVDPTINEIPVTVDQQAAKVEPVIKEVPVKSDVIFDAVTAKVEPIVNEVPVQADPIGEAVAVKAGPISNEVPAELVQVAGVVTARIESVDLEGAVVVPVMEAPIKDVATVVNVPTTVEASKTADSAEIPKNGLDLKVAKTIEDESKNIQSSMSELSKSINSVEKSLGTDVETKAGRPLQELIDTMESVSDKLIVLSKDNSNEEELLKTERTIRGLAKYLEHLEADEAIRLSMALIEQTLLFQNEMKVLKSKAEKAILDNSERLGAKFSEQVLEDRKETQKEAEDFLRSSLDEQAALYKQALHSHLEQQQNDLNEYWKKELKKAVDEEKDLRLQRLDYLTLKLKYLQRISLETSDHLSRQNQITNLQNTINAINRKLESSAQSIEREFMLLKRVGKNDQLAKTVLESVDLKTYMPRDELIDMFYGIKDQLYNNQLTPNQGSVLTYMVSRGMTNLLVPKKGLVPGSDTNSILARLEYYIQRGDFEQACREGNMLKGWPRVLANDWLVGLRGYLNIKQCVDVLETKVKLQGLGIQ